MRHTDLFNLDIHRREAAAGTLLVAEPFMREPHFCHSVIMLIDGENAGGPADADAEAVEGPGSMGVVMNRLTQLTLDEVLPGVKKGTGVPLFSGGPVGSDRLFFLHTLNDVIEGGMEVTPGLWVGGDFEAMTAYVNSGYPVEGHIRFFLGYSGWSNGQLSGELARQSWAVASPLADPSEMLRGDSDAYWHKVVRSMGPHYRAWDFHPQNPLSN